MGDHNEVSKKRLLNLIEKNFNTTIIGSLAVFEECFGELWGHGLPFNDLDEDQRYFRKIWNEARTKILDSGHFNLRDTQSELAQYSLKWNRYVRNFNFKKER